MQPPRVVFGKLLNVFGRPAEEDGLKFLNAAVEVAGASGECEHRLREHPSFKTATNIPLEYDVAFVRARIPRLFGVTPAQAEVEKAFLNEGFVCVFEDAECIPFLCTDTYGFTTLWFDAAVPAEKKARISSTFWSLILASSDEVEDFEGQAAVFGSEKVTLGCRQGEVYADVD
jgi:hypothetical protein